MSRPSRARSKTPSDGSRRWRKETRAHSAWAPHSGFHGRDGVKLTNSCVAAGSRHPLCHQLSYRERLSQRTNSSLRETSPFIRFLLSYVVGTKWFYDHGSRIGDFAVNELLIRFLIGGAVVSVFALLGDVLKPKSFAGLFGAAPSVALATLGLAVAQHGRAYAATEARSMALGAIAFGLYACVVTRLLLGKKLPVLPITASTLLLWLGCALGFWYCLVRSR